VIDIRIINFANRWLERKEPKTFTMEGFKNEIGIY
jgi:hypothetical protein